MSSPHTNHKSRRPPRGLTQPVPLTSKMELELLLKALTELRPTGRAVAAFDADGTLWADDAGEGFFDFQVRHKLVPLPDDPWAHYEYLKDKRSHEEAFLWLAQINQGVALSEVREWAKHAIQERHPLPIFPEVKKLIEHLKSLEVEVYIVTASIKWAVEPAAHLLGLHEDCVIGIETAVRDGIITNEGLDPLTYREGKVRGLKNKAGQLAYFCAGNSEGDLPLLESAECLRLAVASAPKGSELFETEQTLQAHALGRGWFAWSKLAHQSVDKDSAQD